MKKLLVLVLGLMVVGLVAGCISHQKYGTENDATVPVGSDEGLVIKQHGAPDQIVPIGVSPMMKNAPKWDSYLLVYRLCEGDTMLGLMTSDKFSNVCYLVEGGKVTGVGKVGGGSGNSLLFGTFIGPHPRGRGGHGGDWR